MWSKTQLLKMRRNIHLAATSLPDETAVETPELFEAWVVDHDYAVDDRIQYDNDLYKVIQTHHSQDDWTPDVAVSIWVKIDDPSIEWPEWKQPQGAHDAYKAGAKVSHNGFHWINTYGDGNSWEPGVFGWDLVE